MMLAQYSRKFNKGVSIVEIILALALFSIVMFTILTTRWGIEDLAINNSRIISSINASHLKLFDLLNDGSLDFQPENGPFGTMFSMARTPFSRCEETLMIESVWRTGWHSTSTSEFGLLESDLDLANKYGKDCGGHPKAYSDPDLILESTTTLDVLVTHLDVFKNYASVTFRSTTSADPDIGNINLDSPNSFSTLDMGNGLNKIDVVEDYAFAANNSSTTQLAIFRTTTDPLLELVSTSTLPGVSGSRPEAVSIYYFDSKVYIGTKRTAGHEFHIFDVSNREFPEWLGSMEINHNINDISVKNGFAFLATSGNIRDLIILDVRDPTNILQPAVIDLAGNEDGRSIYVAGQYIFLGRHKSTQPGRDELYVLRYGFDPEDGSLTTNILGSAPTGADINAITFAGGFVYVATSNPQKELQFFEFNKGQLIPAGYRDLPANATGVDVGGEKLIVTAGDELFIFKQI